MQQKWTSRKPIKSGQGQGLEADQEILVYKIDVEFRVLDEITRVSDHPIRYTVEDYAVIFSPKPDNQIPLYSRIFRVDPNTFIQGLQGVFAMSLNPGISSGSTGGQGGGGATGGKGSSGGTSSTGATIPTVNSAPGAAAADNGEINFATRPIDTVALHMLLRQYFSACGVILTDPGKTVFFNDRTGLLYVRATEQDLETIEQAIETLNQTPFQVTIEAKFTELSPDEIHSVGLGDYLVKSPNKFTNSSAGKTPPFGNAGGESGVALSGVLEHAEFATIISAIEQHTGNDILSTPKVTTLSGRQVHVGSGGTELDLIASVENSGFALLANGFARVKTKTESWFQNFGSSELIDGQTLVFGGPADARKPEMKVLVVFVTLRLIDAAGNALHTDEEISKHAEIPTK